MKSNTDSLFTTQVLDQIPVHYRLFTQLETEKVGELRVTSRFSTSARHFSSNYLNMPFHKPISNIDTSPLFITSEDAK